MGIVTNHQNKDHKKNEYTSEEIIDMKPQLASQEMWRKGENFYMHGATNTNEQNDDEDLFESFHKNHNSNIKINSPCFDLQDKEMCSNNKECFYDDAYKACFQNCALVNEKKCSLYSECKHTPNGCQNEGNKKINPLSWHIFLFSFFNFLQDIYKCIYLYKIIIIFNYLYSCKYKYVYYFDETILKIKIKPFSVPY